MNFKYGDNLLWKQSIKTKINWLEHISRINVCLTMRMLHVMLPLPEKLWRDTKINAQTLSAKWHSTFSIKGQHRLLERSKTTFTELIWLLKLIDGSKDINCLTIYRYWPDILQKLFFQDRQPTYDSMSVQIIYLFFSNSVGTMKQFTRWCDGECWTSSSQIKNRLKMTKMWFYQWILKEYNR